MRSSPSRTRGVLGLWQPVRGEGIQREMGAGFQDGLLSGMKTLVGIDSMNALPELLFSDEAAMRLAGGNAHPSWEGGCRRSHEKRKGAKAPGPIGPDTLANNLVKLSVGAMETFLNGTIQALAKAKGFPQQGTGIVDGTDLETTA